MKDQEFSQMFIEEAKELIQELEQNILELEKDIENKDIVKNIFRVLHTLKGSGSMFGFDKISNFAHKLEDTFSLIRGGKLKLNMAIVDLTLESVDLFRELTIKNEIVGSVTIGKINEVIEKIEKDFIPKAENLPEEIQEEGDEEEETEKTYRIQFKPEKNIFYSGSDPLLLVEELNEMGEASVKTISNEIPPFDDLKPTACYLSWEIILTTKEDVDAIKDVFIFVEDDVELNIKLIDEGYFDPEEEGYKKIGEILVDRGKIKNDDLKKIIEEQKRFGEIAIKKKIVNNDDVDAALKEQDHVKKVKSKRKKSVTDSVIRVPTDKLNSMVNLVGELVTLQARLTQNISQREDNDMDTIGEEFQRLIWDLRDQTMEMRMIPISSTFSKFSRLVRDLSKDLNKKVKLKTKGGDTELDKTVIDHLGDPLMHLIRNSIDHGLESPEERKAAGKDEAGTVTLAAEHSGAFVLIKIMDDGKGMNKEKILNNAIKRGIVQEKGNLSDDEIYNLIFESGFSTAAEVTNVSGRGVGMDVVRKSIDAIKGFVNIKSEAGKGTTIILKIPMTLAIIDGLLLKITDTHFVIPVNMVEEIVELETEKFKWDNENHYIKVREKLVPFINLRERYGFYSKVPKYQQVVITNVNENGYGFLVDKVFDQHQVVIKSLGKMYKQLENISGATILGDGSIALILDVIKFVKGELIKARSYE